MMYHSRRHPLPIVLLGVLLIGAAVFTSCTHSNNRLPDDEFTCMNFPRLAPDLPFDVDLPNHPNVQCFAWQEFIALNWPADPGRAGQPDRSQTASTWGDPSTTTPGVWETFKEAHEVFLEDAADPGTWSLRPLGRSLSANFEMASMKSLSPRLPESAAEILREAAELTRDAAELDQENGTHFFRMTTKMSPRARLEETEQAFGGTLTGQNGKLTYYSIHLNRQAFDYLVNNRLYDAANHLGTLIDFPSGRTGGGAASAAEGAIIVKSAWLDLTGLSSRVQDCFYSTEACLVEGDRCRWAKVGLVGLHILQKTETFPQWTWATFEHVDNVPDREDVRQGRLKRRYNYYDRNCPPSRECRPNQRPTDATKPVQVVRETPIAENTKELNRLMRREIRRKNRDSVWQFYQLVDVLWPEAGEPVTTIRNAPLPQGAPRPSVLANTTLETYVQDLSCMECHRSATIAPSGGSGHLQASDYSFLLRLADESP